MKDIVSSLKKRAKNFDKNFKLGKRLITSTVMKKCSFKKEKGLLCKTILTNLLMLAFEKKSLYQKAGKTKK